MLPELDEQLVRERIAKRIAMEFEEGEVVNLGIGIPTLVADYIPEGKHVIFQAENGAIGIGPPPSVPNYRCIGAGGRFISLLLGGSFFSFFSSLSKLFTATAGSCSDVTVMPKNTTKFGGVVSVSVVADPTEIES